MLLDESETTYGVSIRISGVSTEQFEKNPVMFYQHNDWNMPVGRWENLRKENGQLLADAAFDYDDEDKDVQRMIKKVEKGFIKMASCGLVDLEGIRDPLAPDMKIVIEKCRLREASIVPIGGNHNAMRLYDRDGQEIDIKNDVGLKLADFIVKPKIEEKMPKNYLQILNLADTATDEMIGAAVMKLSDDLGKAVADKAKAEADLKTATDKIDAIELADKEKRKTEALTLTDAAVKDGRLDAKAKESVLNLFDKDHEAAKTMLANIAKPVSIQDQMRLNDAQKTEFDALNLMDFDQLDKAGKMGKVKADYPQLYEQKFEAKFGKKPNV